MERTIRSLLRTRKAKIEAMNLNFEPGQRIRQYEDISRDQIIATYRDSLAKIRQGIHKEQGRVMSKYDLPPLSQDSLNRELIKVAALDNNSLKRAASGYLTDLPADPLKAYVHARELRARGENDLADSIAAHAQTFLEKPWIKDEEYQRLTALNSRCDVLAANSSEFIVLDLSSAPSKKSIISVQDFDKYSEE